MFQLSNDFEDNLGDLFDAAAAKLITNIENEMSRNQSVARQENTISIAESKHTESNLLFDDLNDDDEEMILSVAEIVDTPIIRPTESDLKQPTRRCDLKARQPESHSSQSAKSNHKTKSNTEFADNQILHCSTESAINVLPPSIPINNKHRLETFDHSLVMKTAKIEYERKFPGPAGLIKKKMTEETVLSTQQERLLALNQSCDSNDQSYNLLENVSWQKLLLDLNAQPELSKIAKEFTIANVRRMNIIKNTSRKIPLFAAVILHVDPSISDPSIILKDSSGEIRGSVHKDFWEEYNSLLSVGSAVLLKQASVLSIFNSRKLFLNITSNNVVTIYTPQFDGEPVLITRLFSISPADCIDLSKVEANSKRKLPSFSSNSPLPPTRSNADLLKIVQSSCTNESASLGSSYKKITPVRSTVNEMKSKSSVTTKSCSTANVSSKFELKPPVIVEYNKTKESNSSIVDNVLDGIDADSFFDDF